MRDTDGRTKAHFKSWKRYPLDDVYLIECMSCSPELQDLDTVDTKGDASFSASEKVGPRMFCMSHVARSN